MNNQIECINKKFPSLSLYMKNHDISGKSSEDIFNEVMKDNDVGKEIKDRARYLKSCLLTDKQVETEIKMVIQNMSKNYGN